MILVNFGNFQHTQQILSTAELWVNFKNLFWQLLLYNISCIMHSFSAMTKVQKEKKNTSPRTAPAMSCSRLKIWKSSWVGKSVRIVRIFCFWKSFPTLGKKFIFYVFLLCLSNKSFYYNKHFWTSLYLFASSSANFWLWKIFVTIQGRFFLIEVSCHDIDVYPRPSYIAKNRSNSKALRPWPVRGSFINYVTNLGEGGWQNVNYIASVYVVKLKTRVW